MHLVAFENAQNRRDALRTFVGKPRRHWPCYRVAAGPRPQAYNGLPCKSLVLYYIDRAVMIGGPVHVVARAYVQLFLFLWTLCHVDPWTCGNVFTVDPG